MSRSNPKSPGATAAVNASGELCRNGCEYYGNKTRDEFCSNCYREVDQQARHIQETYDDKLR